MKSINGQKLNGLAVSVDGNLLAVSGNRSSYNTAMKAMQTVNGIWLFDVTNPAQPWLLRQIETQSVTFKNAVLKGGKLYTACATDGVRIYDAATLDLLGSYDTPGFAWSVLLDGTTLWVADGSALLALDVANPAAITVKGTLAGIFPRYLGSKVGTRLYCGDSGGVAIVNISNPAAPVKLGLAPLSGYPFSPQGAWADASHKLYIAAGSAGIAVFDCANPSAPVRTNVIPLPDAGYYSSAVGFTPDGQWIAAAGGGLMRFANNAFTETYWTPGTARDICQAGQILYLADSMCGLVVFAPDAWTPPTTGGTPPPPTPIPASLTEKGKRYDSIAGITAAPLPSP